MMATASLHAADTQPVTELRIDNIKHVTSQEGRLQLSAIIRLSVDDMVCMHLPDGREIKAKVFRREEENGESLKVYGESITDEDYGFGFVMNAKKGFGGAVLFRKTGEVYAVEFSSELNCYIFVKRGEVPRINI
jgi:hypothetical protein